MAAVSVRRVVAALVLLGALLLTASTYRDREFDRWLDEETSSPDRYVDAHVRLHVVAKDPAGIETDPTKLPELRIHRFGAWIDTQWIPPRLMTRDGAIGSEFTECELGEGRDWYCSEDQESVVLHGSSCGCDWCEKPRASVPAGKLALGGMGAGKTTAGVLWTYLRWLEHVGARWTDPEAESEVARSQMRPAEGGITAPTQTRVDVVLNELFGMFAPNWYRYRSSEGVVTMCDGTRIRAVSTYKQSASQGSPLQGFNWSWWMGDEMQDQIDEYINVEARLRSAKTGNGKRLATATAKDSPAWRTWLAGLDVVDWMTHPMLGIRSPFVADEHWAKMRRSTTERDYRRLVLAEDLPSEARVYSGFDRKRNLRPIPTLGARKITSIVLSRKTGDKRDAIGIGHDPGTAKAGSVWLDAYELNSRKGEVLWWVRSELFTLHKSTEQHATEALKITRDRFGCNVRPDSERAHVRCQPIGQAEDKPDLDVFAIWQRVGFSIKAAQYSKQGQGIGQIKKDSRIAVINTLFEKSRLFIECDDRQSIMCPTLVEAIETMERDYRGRAEHEEKVVKHDKSDLPAALGYFLWPFEKELAMALRSDIQKGLTS